MFSLVLDVGGWVARRIGWFFLILALLWAGWLVQAQFRDLAALESNVQYLKNGEFKLRNDLSELRTQTEQSVARLKTATVARLDQRISELTKQIESKNRKLLELDSILTKLNPAKHLDVARLKIEVELATQELEHLRYLKEISAQSSKLGKLAGYCENIRQQHVGEWEAYKITVAKLTALNASGSKFLRWMPLSDEFRTRQALKAERRQHAINTQNLKLQHGQCLADLSAAQRVLNGLEKAKVFVLNNKNTQAALAELNGQIQAIQGKADKHWLKPLLFDPLRQMLPIALGILAAAILVPIAIKLILYFVLAPLAAKQSPICLQPNSEARNPAGMPDSKSAVSLSIEVAPDSELVVQSSYFHSAPDRCTTSPRLLLNNRFVMTSLAAGMYDLTVVRGNESFVATVSSGQESLAELLRIEIGEGEAVCIHPSNLVGILQKLSSPATISSHWRLGSLQAWLTLQLRYLVFHGPASIIVKGDRGVRVESAVEGRAIEQVSTVGFSANLNYSTTRTETVMAYLTGKKGLLRDRFSGQSGFFIFEEMPNPSKRSGITGRGFEGVSDAVLKLFGI